MQPLNVAVDRLYADSAVGVDVDQPGGDDVVPSPTTAQSPTGAGRISAMASSSTTIVAGRDRVPVRRRPASPDPRRFTRRRSRPNRTVSSGRRRLVAGQRDLQRARSPSSPSAQGSRSSPGTDRGDERLDHRSIDVDAERHQAHPVPAPATSCSDSASVVDRERARRCRGRAGRSRSPTGCPRAPTSSGRRCRSRRRRTPATAAPCRRRRLAQKRRRPRPRRRRPRGR